MQTEFATAIAATALCAMVAGCATTDGKPGDVPAALLVAAPQTLKQQLHATGVQIYLCQATKADATRFEWAFKEPEAKLFTKRGSNIGKHYAGPTWEANDGSKVTGELVARSNSPEPGSIPWLLLNAKTNSTSGIFVRVKSIQRLHTAGGAAPAGGCSQAQAGQELRVTYSADYLFYE
jgi:FtsP/CotA-like multicopper oxidase with cupredoxin domain